MELKESIFSRIPMMGVVPEMFLYLSPNNPLLNDVWQTILLLSYFNPKDTEYLISLHSDIQNDEFLWALTAFHVNNIKKGKTRQHPPSFSSLTDKLSARLIPEPSRDLAPFYQYYEKIVRGVCVL